MRSVRALTLIKSIREHEKKEAERLLARSVQLVEKYRRSQNQYSTLFNSIVSTKKISAQSLSMMHHMEEAQFAMNEMITQEKEIIDKKKEDYIQKKNKEKVISNLLEIKEREQKMERNKLEQSYLDEIAQISKRGGNR